MKRSARPAAGISPMHRHVRCSVEALEARQLLAVHYVNPGASIQTAVDAALSGDTVHLNAGTHVVPGAVNVKPGVTVEGAGQGSTTVRSSSTSGYVFALNSSSLTNGNQEIRDLTIDGNNRANANGVQALMRHNVKIRRVTFNNLNAEAIQMRGAGWAGGRDNRITGGEIANVTINNSGTDFPANNVFKSGNILVGTSTGLTIRDTTINSPAIHSHGIKYDWNAAGDDREGGWNYGLLIYNTNISIAGDFGVELFNAYNGSEIYNSVMSHCISMGGQKDDVLNGDGTIDVRAHHNTFNFAADNGLAFECQGGDFEVDHNYFKNPGTYGVAIWQAGGPDEINRPRRNYYIHHNIFDSEGTTTGTHKAFHIGGANITNVNVYNNTMVGLDAGIDLLNGVVSANVRNNTWSRGQDGSYVFYIGSANSNVNFTNNLWGDTANYYGYTWGSPSAIRIDGSPSNFSNSGNFANQSAGLTYSGNRPDPYFRPTTGSNLIDKGTTTGLPAFTSSTALTIGANAGGITDPKNTYTGTSPDLGAYESGSSGVTLRDPDNPANSVNGLDRKRYLGTWDLLPNFGTLTPSATDTSSSFAITTGVDNFGYVFSGYVNAPADGTYTFYTASDDGSKLYVGSTEVVNNDGLHGEVEKSGTIGLKAGKHALKVTFFEKNGGEVLKVSWAGPNLAKALIPDNQLFRVASTTTNTKVSTGGTAGASSNPVAAEDVSKAFDGSTGTKWLGNMQAGGAWIKYDFAGTSANVVKEFRITSANDDFGRDPKDFRLQGSNDGTAWSDVGPAFANQQFSSRFQTLTFSVSGNSTAYQQYRLLITANDGSTEGGAGLVQVAELELWGIAGSTSSAKLTGTVIGTSGSYQNNTSVTRDKVFDGNLGTFFDAPESTNGNGAWVGLDLGSTKTIASIKFAPRSLWASRMIGGVFQVSNDQSSWTTIHTVNAAPTEGVLTTQNVSVSGTWRYVRYLSPNGGWGNIAEMEAWGY